MSQDDREYLTLPSNIYLYLEEMVGGPMSNERTAYFVQPNSYMAGFCNQIIVKNIKGTDINIIQLLAEPGTGFGAIIFVGKRGTLPNPCTTSGSDIFKEFLFNALKICSRESLLLLGIDRPDMIDFAVIISRAAPNYAVLKIDNFNNGGFDRRVYGSVLLAGDEVYDMIDKNMRFGNQIFLVSSDYGTINLDETQKQILISNDSMPLAHGITTSTPSRTIDNVDNVTQNDQSKKRRKGGRRKKSRKIKKLNRHRRRMTRKRKY
jgi:hypothetical protein